MERSAVCALRSQLADASADLRHARAAAAAATRAAAEQEACAGDGAKEELTAARVASQALEGRVEALQARSPTAPQPGQARGKESYRWKMFAS